MKDTIALLKAISYIVWPICLLLIVFMFRKEIRTLLIILFRKEKENSKIIGDKLPEPQKHASLTSEPSELPSNQITDDFASDDQLIIQSYKNINSDKDFVVLEENEDKIKAITPDGKIDWFQRKLFHETTEDIAVDLLPEVQREQFYWWIQTEPVVSKSGNIKKQPIAGYLTAYMGMLKNPQTEPSRMLNYIKSNKEASWSETQKHLHDKYGYGLKSGSMGASLRALEEMGLVKVDGQGGNKKIVFTGELIGQHSSGTLKAGGSDITTTRGWNRETLDRRFQFREIDIRRGSVFDVAELPFRKDFDRIQGMMLGLAIGDALGNTTEGLTPEQRRERFGEIRDYQFGLPSDDTQLAFWTLEQILEDGEFIPLHVANHFCSGFIFGIGSTVKTFLRNQYEGKEWYQCGPKSAGNGALMRIAPMVIPHLKSETTDLWVDTALSAMMTHNDSASISSCLAFIFMLRQLLVMDHPPKPRWWLDTYINVSKDLETDETYRTRGSVYPDYQGPLWRFVEEKVGDAYRKDLSILDACNSWNSGAYLLETMPSVIYILMRHGQDFEEAVVRAVNDTKDNDTIAAIVGAAMGALHGKKAIPEQWLRKLSGRTRENDNGKIFNLLDMIESL